MRTAASRPVLAPPGVVRRAIAPLSGLFALALAAGCGGGEGGPGGGFQPPPTAVEVAEVEVGPLVDTFSTVGTIEATEAVTVVSEIAGIVKSLPFTEGDEVPRGALLARLDDAELAAAVTRAEAVRDQRQTVYDRVRRIVEEGAGAPQDLDDAASNLKVAKADLDLARARLAKTRITAPFDGMVGRRLVSPGAFVTAGEPIARLARISEVEVDFSVPERFTGDIRRGAKITVSTPAYPGHQVEGEITVVDPVLDARTRNLTALARIPNPDRRFRPGMSANVNAVLSRRDSALTIPNEAVFAEGEQFLAYVVQADSTVARAVLELGTRKAGRVEILSGVQPGDRVVRAGHQKLYPGAKVMAVPAGGRPGGPPGAPGTAGPGEGGPGEAGPGEAGPEEGGRDDGSSAVAASDGEDSP